MNLIVAVSDSWGIGKDNKLLFSIPSDMKFFRNTTKDKIVIMGKKTLESFPDGAPLKNRTNIVLSKKIKEIPGATVIRSIEGLLNHIKDMNSEDIFVIGGESVYRELLPYCDTAYVTKVYSNKAADTFMVNLDSEKSWELEKISESILENGLSFAFCKYKNIKAQKII